MSSGHKFNSEAYLTTVAPCAQLSTREQMCNCRTDVVYARLVPRPLTKSVCILPWETTDMNKIPQFKEISSEDSQMSCFGGE